MYLSVAHPFNFVAHVELGSNVVRGIEELPLQVNTKEEETTDSNILPSLFSEVLPPNTVRSELYRFNRGSGGGRGEGRVSFKISGTEELQR